MNRVLVVDDHPLVALIMLEQARAAFPGAQVDIAGSVAEAIERASEGVDIAMLDLGLPGCSGIEALTRMRAAYPEARVAVVSATEERAVILAALEAGAVGYIPKTSKPNVVTAALRLIGEGGVYVPPQVLGDEPAAARKARASALTGRQLEVLRLLARGLANKEIAQNLRIGQETVKQHARAVFAALAGAERYDYDALGRLVRVIDEQGRVTEYVYDPAGNLLQVIVTGAGGAPAPAVTSISPGSVRRGETRSFVITGTGLTGARLSTTDPALEISQLQASATQITFDLTVLASAPLGAHLFSLSNAAGSASVHALRTTRCAHG